MADQSLSARLRKVTQPVPPSLFQTLITANHILHHHGIVDAYGHISVRSPSDPNTFFLSASVAPTLVTSRKDIVEYKVEDAAPVKSDETRRGYLERYIHSEIYKKYKDVNAVVHAHSESTIPFSVSSVPLRPVFHMGGVMGAQVPVYDIALHYNGSDNRHDLLISNQHLGASLAASFNPGSMVSRTTNVLRSFLTSSQPESAAFPSSPVVLMRGHGFTCVGKTIEETVYRAVYTCTNARVQTTSLLLQAGYNTGLLGEKMGKLGGTDGGAAGAAKKPELESVKFLSDREAHDAWEANSTQASRPWGLWTREVERSGLYDSEFYKTADTESDKGEEEAEEEGQE